MKSYKIKIVKFKGLKRFEVGDDCVDRISHSPPLFEGDRFGYMITYEGGSLLKIYRDVMEVTYMVENMAEEIARLLLEESITKSFKQKTK